MAKKCGKSPSGSNRKVFTCCEIDVPDVVADDDYVADGGGGVGGDFAAVVPSA